MPRNDPGRVICPEYLAMRAAAVLIYRLSTASNNTEANDKRVLLWGCVALHHFAWSSTDVRF